MGAVSSVGSTSLLNGWNECNDCNYSQTNFNHTFSTPGVYLIRTHNWGTGSQGWNWNSYTDAWVTVNAPIANGALTLNGTAGNVSYCSNSQNVTIAQSGGTFQGGDYWYWIANVTNVGDWPGSWNVVNQGYANTPSFNVTLGPGVYAVHTNGSNICGWGTGVTRYVTINPLPVAPQAVANVAVGTPAVLPDANITSTGYCCNGDHSHIYGRVFDRRAASNWSATDCCDVTNQYIQFDLGSIKPFNGVATQGRHNCCAQWVGTIDIQYSLDGTTWVFVPGGPFPGNTDNQTVTQNIFGQYHARYVRVWPRSVSQHITMRAEVISIPEEASTVNISADVVDNATTVRWYDAASGGTLLATGQVYTTPVLTQNTTYYAAAYNANTGCESASRTAVTAKVNTMYGAGPAGIGSTDAKSDLKLWLNAGSIGQGIGSTVTSWADLSGNGNAASQGNGSQQPVLQTQSVLNNQKAVRFTTDDYLTTQGNIVSQFEPYTVLSASRMNGGQNFRLITSSARNWLLGYWGGFENVMYAEGWISGGCGGTGGVGASTNGNIFTGDGNGRWTRLFGNGTFSWGNGCGTQSPGGLSLGAYPGSEYSNGDVSEAILFNKVISNARRNILDNYLAAKYSIAISNDVYAGDSPTNGDCDFELSGIGRDTEGWHQKSRSGGLFINDAGFLANAGDYFLYGHNSGNGGWETSNLATCTGNPTRRISRIWYFSKTDAGANGGNITLSFKASDLGIPNFDAGTYTLVSRAANSGNFATAATGTYSASEITFTLNTASLANGQYTLAFEATTPAAVSFTGNGYILHSTSGMSSTGGTVMGWVRPTQTADWGFWQTHDSDSENWVDWISMFSWVDGTFYIRIGDGTTCCNNDLTFSTASYIPNNQWTHLAFTWGGGVVTAYANGVQIAQRTVTLQGTMDPWARIGEGHGRLMKGMLDEMAMYNTPLSAAQIQGLMHANVNNANGLWGNLVGYYKANENSTSVYDMSQNNNNGTRVGGSYTSLYTAGPSISGSTSQCISTTVNYTSNLVNTNSRVVYNWSVTGGTINSGQGTSQISVTWNTAGSQTVALSITHSNECHTESATSLTVAVSAATVGGTVSPATQTICTNQGVVPTQNTLSGHTGGVVQWEYKTPSSGWIVWPGTTTTAPGACCFTSIGTWQVRALVQNGPCSQAYSSIADIVVVADPVSPGINPSVASGSTVCTGASLSATITAGSGGAGTVADVVEFSTNSGTNWSAYTSGAAIIASTAGTNIIQIRSIRTANGSNCDNPTYNTVMWSVAPDPTISINNASQPSCYGTSTTLTTTETGGTGSCGYQWQSRPVGGSTWTNLGTASSQSTGAITVSTEFRVIRTCSGIDCGSVTSNTVTLTVHSVNTWTGAAGSGGVGNWDNPSNWSCGIVPTSIHDVIIPNSTTAPNQPVIRNKTTFGVAYCNSIVIQPGANVTTQANGELRVND
jgi:hypothetical protein